jgi:hypothetical protein
MNERRKESGMDDLKFNVISPPEKSRTYIFPAGSITVLGVSGVCVRPSGTHRLECSDGARWIIPAGWLGIKLDIADWTL